MQSMKAIIDLDDTLGGLRYVLMDTMNRLKGKAVHWSTWDVLSMEHVYNITNDEFLDIAKETMLLERSQPHPEARDFMYKLFDAGIETTILTARGWHPYARRMTECWLGLYGIPYTEVKVCELEDDKADYIRHMDNILLTIDDSVRHCNSYASLTKNRPQFVFAYTMPWNKNKLGDGIIPIENLHDVGKYIEGL